MTTATDDVPVETPVIVEGKGLAVSCSNNDCDAKTGVPTDIDGQAGDPGPDDWTITFTTNDGSLVVHEAYCPKHRVGDAIDELAAKQSDLGESIHETLRQATAMAPD